MKAGGMIVAVCAVVVSAAAATGCLSDNDSVVTDVPPGGWNTTAEMVYTNRDTISERRALLFMRHDNRIASGRYAIEYHAPSGEIVIRDTFSLRIRQSSSVPPATSMGWEWPHGNRIRLAEQGAYTISVTPLQNTVGVWNVGINFNPAEE